MTTGLAWVDIAIVISISLAICATVCTLAMEAAVLFIPSFLFVFPHITYSFPVMTPNAAIGSAMIIEVLGDTSSMQLEFPKSGESGRPRRFLLTQYHGTGFRIKL